MLRQILSPTEYAYINIGQLTISGSVRRFAVSSGIGFDADVCFHNISSRIKRTLNRLKLGKLSYTAIALFLLLKLKPCPMTLELDGRNVRFKKVFFATAMNQQYEGGGFCFCPDADPGDDLLDVIVISDISKLKALLLLPTAYAGLHTRVKGVHIYTCRRASISSPLRLPVHTDGEPAAAVQEVTYSLEPEKLRLIRA